jgi:hypothetical protein
VFGLCFVQESMETKTEMESDLHLTVQPTMTVGEVQKEVEKRLGWLPTSQLKRHLSLLPHSARCCAISVCSRCIDCLTVPCPHKPAQKAANWPIC